MEEQSTGGFAQASEIRIVLRVDTSLIEAKLAEAREAAFRAAALHLEAHRLPPTLEGLAEGVDSILDGDDDLAAELRGLAHDVGLSPALAEQVDSALARFQRAMARLEQVSSLLTEEVARRAAEGPRPQIVPADDISAHGILTLNLGRTLQGLRDSITWLDEASRRLPCPQPDEGLGQVSGFGTVAQMTTEGLRIVEVSTGAPGFAALTTPPPEPPKGVTLTMTGEHTAVLSSSDAPTLTRAELEATQELREAIRGKVEAAVTAGRRVNVLELGSREHTLLGLADRSHYPLELDELLVGKLAVRIVGLPSALSVYYDAEV